ncbi:GspE/PulE family protein [Anaerobaca lacustris]|uniref:ATPase, T2SS/T4P/T4SS family n=1 Tax=Anaerobaca lacustris TaxID=3044600 RepID=A0AAW6U3R3_9BACT|nr:ATPase, T2SS/T4P/T4SS family [Sedimentisphaerales bacterium M17dextr]
MKTRDPIIAILEKESLVDPAVLDELIESQEGAGRSVLEALQRQNLLSEEQVVRTIALANGSEYVDLAAETIDPTIAHLISRDLATRHNAIPIRRQDRTLFVAMGAPWDLAARDEIEVKTGYGVTPVAASPAAIRQVVQRLFDEVDITKQVVASMRLKEDAGASTATSENHVRTLREGDDPISKLVSSIVRGAISSRASDVHIEPQLPDLRVRYRIDGTLRDTIRVPASVQREVVSHIKIMADMDISERRIPQDGHATIEHEGAEYDLRVSSLPAVGGEKVVLRILDKRVERWSFDKVVTSPHDNRTFRQILSNPYGMLLLTGPTGSGKTTTLYSVLQLINTADKNIVTVEDPVEYRLDGITQVQVKPVAGMTFPSALRSILRQDPDIILIGEIRDRETAEIAIGAALTGHLVLSTLHTNDAAGAVSRLVNLGIPSFLVGSALLGSAAQRLVRILCPKCKTPYRASESDVQVLYGAEPDDEVRLWRGTGCSHCYETGYLGRKSVYEILPVSRAVQRKIIDKVDDDAIREHAIAEGMRTLRAAAVSEVLAGQTTVEEIVRTVDMEWG